MGGVTVAPECIGAGISAYSISHDFAGFSMVMNSVALPDLSSLALRCESIGAGGESDEESGEEGDRLLEILRRRGNALGLRVGC